MPVKRILNAVYCGDLFPRDLVAARELYHDLAKKVHPDICTDPCAEDAMDKLNKLYQRAQQCLEQGTWEADHMEWLISEDGSAVSVKYLFKSSFEQGVRYVCATSVLWLFSDKKDAHRFEKQLSRIRYHNDKMKTEFSHQLPQLKKTIFFADGSCGIVVAKTVDQFPLDLVLKNVPDLITDRHLAWITSRLCNLCCFFSHNNLSHNGLIPSNLFISAEKHSLSVLGGWQYAAMTDEKMQGVPRAVYDIMPATVKTSKTGNAVTDIESVKLIGRNVSKNLSLPKPVRAFYHSGSGDSISEFRKWSYALHEAYGKRTFVPLTLTNKQVYQ